jgi:hypothetical protein
MKKILFLVLVTAQAGFAQQSVNLDSCIVWAKQHYPLVKQNRLVQEMSQTGISAISENWRFRPAEPTSPKSSNSIFRA